MSKTNYAIDTRVILNTPYNGDYENPEGYRVGSISEVIVPGKMYSIALDGYFNRFVDFSVNEFSSLEVYTVVTPEGNQRCADYSSAKTLRSAIPGAKLIICHDRRLMV